MMMWISVLVFALALPGEQHLAEGVFSRAAETARSVELLDANQYFNIEEVAREVCKTMDPGYRNSQRKQLSRISTISKLVDFFKSIKERHPLAACASLSKFPLEKLEQLLLVNNENVCSEGKISRIESYHRDFVSTAFEDVAGRNEEDLELPIMIRNFFMNYALEVGAICRKSMLSNIQWDVQGVFSEAEFQFSDLHGVLESILNKLTIYKHPVESVNDFDDLFLSWEANLGSALLDLDTNHPGEINALTGEPIRIRMKVANLGPIQYAQKKCRYEFRPIYSKLIIPIVKLANLGYSWQGGRFERESEALRSSKMASNLYSAAQVCEAILPIRFYQDRTLASDEAQVISYDEARRLISLQIVEAGTQDGQKRIRRLTYEPETNSMERVDKLDWVETEEAQELIERIELSKSPDERAIDRAMEQISRNIRQSRRPLSYPEDDPYEHVDFKF